MLLAHINPQEFTSQTEKAYLFTTENITYYLGRCHLALKKVAAVASSGDFAFNAFLAGALSVDCFDISPRACFFAELKKAALQKLSYEDFLRFFFAQDSSYFSYALYEPLRTVLRDGTRGFFDELIQEKGTSPLLQESLLIIDKIKEKERIISANPYLAGQESYQAAQKAVREITFTPLGVDSFLEGKEGQYDFIYLSNIFCYPPFTGKSAFHTLLKALQCVKEEGEVVTLFFIAHNEMPAGLKALYQALQRQGHGVSRFIFPSISQEHCLFLLSVCRGACRL